MSANDTHYLIGVFENEDDIVEATSTTRAYGYTIHDVYAPYAVHGLPEAMGLKPSRLTWACLAFALTGFTVALTAQFWISVIDWPVNVGGRPFNSLPAFLPVMFECIVLFGGVGVTLTMLARTRLYPGRKERLVHPDITNHRFVLEVIQKDSSFDPEALTALWEQYHVIEVRQLPEVAA